jgi:hypothetical protein
MLRFAAAALAFAAMATSAMAQTGNSLEAGQMIAQNSGAGVAGQPGNKNGPAAKPPSGTVGAGAGTGSSQAPANDTSRPQDTSKVPGLPGSKSGPAVKSPSKSDGR